MASALAHGSVRLAAYEPARLNDPVTRELMERVNVDVDPELDAAFPGQRAARVEVVTRAGQRFGYLQPNRKGDPEQPLTDAELDSKFLELSSPVTGADTAKTLLSRLWRLEASELPGFKGS